MDATENVAHGMHGSVSGHHAVMVELATGNSIIYRHYLDEEFDKSSFSNRMPDRLIGDVRNVIF